MRRPRPALRPPLLADLRPDERGNARHERMALRVPIPPLASAVV